MEIRNTPVDTDFYRIVAIFPRNVVILGNADLCIYTLLYTHGLQGLQLSS